MPSLSLSTASMASRSSKALVGVAELRVIGMLKLIVQ